MRKLANPFVGLNIGMYSYSNGAVLISSCLSVVFPSRLICISLFMSRETSVHTERMAL